MSARKKYRPKAVMTNPLASLSPMKKEQADRLMLHYLTALNAIRGGRYPGAAEWRDLADMVNVCETAVKMGRLLNSEVIPHVMVATDAMRECAQRYTKTGVMRLNGPGLAAMDELANVHQQILDVFTEREFCVVVAETRRVVHALQKSGKHTVESL